MTSTRRVEILSNSIIPLVLCRRILVLRLDGFVGCCGLALKLGVGPLNTDVDLCCARGFLCSRSSSRVGGAGEVTYARCLALKALGDTVL